ncbi:MAG: hydrogenase maturation protease [Actinomycetota bacterium]|nr:hydrogenase maturation protease [Actinomycetota bacterium]
MHEIKKKTDVGTIYKVIGFGNMFMSDDGIGIRVIEELNKMNFSDDHKNVVLIDGGTSGIDLILTIKESDKVIIIDAVDVGQDIGEVVKFKANKIEKFDEKRLKSCSLHDLNLTQVFDLMNSLDVNFDITVIGIKPKVIGYGEKISPEIECKIPEIISNVIQEIGY